MTRDQAIEYLDQEIRGLMDNRELAVSCGNNSEWLHKWYSERIEAFSMAVGALRRREQIMRCPNCGSQATIVIERWYKCRKEVVVRKRMCDDCKASFVTEEKHRAQ